jgi:hypothetical protein
MDSLQSSDNQKGEKGAQANQEKLSPAVPEGPVSLWLSTLANFILTAYRRSTACLWAIKCNHSGATSISVSWPNLGLAVRFAIDLKRWRNPAIRRSVLLGCCMSGDGILAWPAFLHPTIFRLARRADCQLSTEFEVKCERSLWYQCVICGM